MHCVTQSVTLLVASLFHLITMSFLLWLNEQVLVKENTNTTEQNDSQSNKHHSQGRAHSLQIKESKRCLAESFTVFNVALALHVLRELLYFAGHHGLLIVHVDSASS